MWKKFSDRIGVTESSAIQIDRMSLALRNSLWNLLLSTVFAYTSEFSTEVVREVWRGFLKRPIDDLPSYPDLYQARLKEVFYSESFDWYQVYNLIEFLAREVMQDSRFEARANQVLEEENSGYRFVDGRLVPISGKEEIQSIETSIAITEGTGLSGVRQHLETAIDLLAQKPDPDYRNSIKESISAIESLARQITGKGNFSRAIAKLDAEIGFHGGFKSALNQLYGYSSDEDGIRHAILEEKDVGFDEAKFMLVICSALVNFIVSKAVEHGLIDN